MHAWTDNYALLAMQLLRHGASRIAKVRSQAAASLYTLLRHAAIGDQSQHTSVARNFARVKMQITVGLSQLVSDAGASTFRFPLHITCFLHSNV